MNKPILLSINAFDKNNGNTFKFTIDSELQIVKNTINIYDSETQELLITDTINSYAFEHTLSGSALSVLENGKSYYATIIAYDSNNVASSESDFSLFYCYTTPTITISIPVNNATYGEANIDVIALYEQIEDELPNEALIRLYNENLELIKTNKFLFNDTTHTPSEGIVISSSFNELIDDSKYYVDIVATTINNTTISTNKIAFYIRYDGSNIPLTIGAKNDCANGKINIHSKLSVMNGRINMINPSCQEPNYVYNRFLDKYDLEIYKVGDIYNNGNDSNVEWYDGLNFNLGNFCLGYDWSPILFGDVVNAKSKDGKSSFNVKFDRGNFTKNNTSEIITIDYLEVTLIINEQIVFCKKFSMVKFTEPDMEWGLTNNARIASRIIINNNQSTQSLCDYMSAINLNGYSSIPYNQLIFNPFSSREESNVEYNKITDLLWQDEGFGGDIKGNYDSTNGEINSDNDVDIKADYNVDGTSFMVLNNKAIYLTLEDGNYYEIFKEKWSVVEGSYEWDSGTILGCNFNQDIVAGNIDFSLSQLDEIKIKRRETNGLDWIEIYKHKVETSSDVDITLHDYFLPSGREYEWALVPSLHNSELKYFISEPIKTNFNGLFISDKTKTMKLYGNVSYGNTNITQPIGLLQPFNKKYPKVILNSIVNYETITVSGSILKLDNLNRIDLTPTEIVKQKEEWNKFLTNGLPKVVKDWCGNIILGMVTTTPSYSYGIGLLIPTITFTVTEQGKYDNQQDLIDNNMILE